MKFCLNTANVMVIVGMFIGTYITHLNITGCTSLIR